MAPLNERQRALEDFIATPQTMDAICNSLHLIYGKQVHKDIVRAIVQITGYGKQYVKDCGRIEPRKLLRDGTHSTTFNPNFEALVEHFLFKLKAGVVFFPIHLPHYHGWEDSFWDEDLRFQWNTSVEREDIRGGILLMFENIKNNGAAIDLTKAEVYESFTTTDCDDCGSGEATDTDDIIYCDTCRVGHHQSCYDIYPNPGRENPWKCKVCDSAKQVNARVGASNKRKSSISPNVASKFRIVRPKKENSDYSDSSPTTTSDIQGTSLGARVSHIAAHLKDVKRHSSLIGPQNEGHLHTSRRSVSQPVKNEASKSRRATLAQIPPLNTVDVSNEDPTPSFNVPKEAGIPVINAPKEQRSSSLVLTSRNSSRRSSLNVGNISKNMPGPDPRLQQEKIEGTILLTRLKDQEIYRKVPLTIARTVNDLFKECAKRWSDKFVSGDISRLLYIDDENHLVEIVKGNDADYKELLRMIRRLWDSKGREEVVRVKLILLAAGEEA